jgi:hypothetical protein
VIAPFVTADRADIVIEKRLKVLPQSLINMVASFQISQMTPAEGVEDIGDRLNGLLLRSGRYCRFLLRLERIDSIIKRTTQPFQGNLAGTS